MTFDSSREKIKWANHRISELQASIQSFVRSDFWQLLPEDNPNAGSQTFRVEISKEIPRSIPLIIGDVVHNLGCAMDHMMVTIFPDQAEWISYPTRRARDDVMNTRVYKFIQKTFPILGDVLLDKISSYDTGQPSVWAACQLNNLDKHRLLIPIITVTKISGICAEAKNNIRVTDHTVIVGPSGGGIGFGLPGPIKITDHGKAAVAVLFDKGQPLEGQPVVGSLLKTSEIVFQAVQTLELFWFEKRHNKS